MDWAKLSEVKPGDRLIADGGFTCLVNKKSCTVHRDVISRELFVRCDDGEHYLAGQADDGEHLIGFTVDVNEYEIVSEIGARAS